MKSILVTGGSGFIGSHLCRRLIALGHRVTALDNFITSEPQLLADLANHKHFTLVEHDILTPFDGQFDQIYNLACPASPLHYQDDPIRTMMVNTVGSKYLLDLAVRSKARILQASTSEIYGNPEIHPQPESYSGNVNPIGPRGCYDEGKRAAETLFFDYQRRHSVDIRIARIFNSYGPGMLASDGRVVSTFITQALVGEPLTIYGDGLQTRSFCYIDDLVEGLIRLMEKDGVTGPVNLGNPEECTIEELAETILHLSGSYSNLNYKPLPQDDPQRRCPDITLAKNLLGWQPKIGLERGLKKTIAAFKKAKAA